jgi:hypothetical protein
LAENANGPGPGFKQTQHQFNQGRLPAPVGADHNHKITGLQTEVNVHQHRLPVVGKIEILYVNNGVAHNLPFNSGWSSRPYHRSIYFSRKAAKTADKKHKQ